MPNTLIGQLAFSDFTPLSVFSGSNALNIGFLMVDFVALGNLTLDDVVTADGQVTTGQLGGACVYTAAGMRLWGESVAIVSVAGRDFPEKWLNALGEAGIDVSGVKRIDQDHLMRSRALYFQDGSRIEQIEAVSDNLRPDVGKNLLSETGYTDFGTPKHRKVWPIFSPSPHHIAARHLSARFAHLAPGPVRNNRLNATFLKQQTSGLVTITLDWPWWDFDREAKADIELLKHIDYLLPSKEELQMHFNYHKGDMLFEAAKDLLAYGPQGIVVKQGQNGARVFSRRRREWQYIPIYPTDVVDPTGAGDSFCGGFLIGMARTGDIVQAAYHGAVSASFVIEDFGVRHALAVTAKQAETRLHKLQTMEES